MGTPLAPGRREAGPRPVAARQPRMHGSSRTCPLDKVFDYLIPEHLAPEVRVGTMVRVALQGRRIGGMGGRAGRARPATDRPLRPLAKVTGWGPPADLVALGPVGGVAVGRAAPRSSSAPPRRRGPCGPCPCRPRGQRRRTGARRGRDGRAHPAGGRRAARRAWPPPATATPSCWRRRHAPPACLAARLRREGHRVALVPQEWALAAAGGCVAVGARAGAWAPRPRLGAVRRGRRGRRGLPGGAGADLERPRRRRGAGPPGRRAVRADLGRARRWRRSACGPLVMPSRTEERGGWPVVEVVDRRPEPPGLRPVLLPPRRPGPRRHARRPAGLRAEPQGPGPAAGLRHLPRAHPLRAVRRRGRRHRGRTPLPALRHRTAPDLPGLRRHPPGHPAGRRDPGPGGAGAAGQPAGGRGLGRHRRRPTAGGGAHPRRHRGGAAPGGRRRVGGLPRLRPGAAGPPLPGRRGRRSPCWPGPARLVGGRSAAGRLLVQTRMPGHEVVDAALHADPSRLAVVEAARRAALRFPPETAVAAVSGQAAPAFVAALAARDVWRCLGRPTTAGWFVPPTTRPFATRSAATPRPPGRLRIEVDPLRA